MYNRIYDFLYKVVICSIASSKGAYKNKNTGGLLKEFLKILVLVALIALLLAILLFFAVNLFIFYMSQIASVRWIINLAIIFFILPLVITLLRRD